jgi:MATE family multidrug resistance protein
MLLMPSTLAALFLDPKLPQATEVWHMASHLMLFAACFQILDGAQAVSAAMLRGLQDTQVPMLLAIAGYWLMGLAPAAYWAYALDMQGTGVWLGLISGLGSTAIMLTTRWVWLTRRT